MWLRLYTELLNDPKVAKLSDDQFRAYILTLCAMKEHGRNGRIPIEDMHFHLRTTAERWEQVQRELVKFSFLIVEGKEVRVNGWERRQYESDLSTERTRRFKERRSAVPGNVPSPFPGTPPEQSRTETEQNRTEFPPTPLAGGNTTPADSEDRINALANSYPTTAGKQQGIRAICEIVSESADQEAALTGIERHWSAWCAMLAERDAQYRPRLDRFVRSHDWMHPPPEQTRKGKAAEQPAKPDIHWDASQLVDAQQLGLTAEEFAAKLAKDLGDLQ